MTQSNNSVRLDKLLQIIGTKEVELDFLRREVLTLNQKLKKYQESESANKNELEN